MSLIDKIPEMTDEGVVNLLANARRLHESGTAKQQADAAEILPALEEACAQRKQNRLDAAAAKRAATKKPRKVAA